MGKSKATTFGTAMLSMALMAAPEATADPYVHKGPWPIQGGFDLQPSEKELRALHQQDVAPEEAREVDRLYDQLLSDSDKILRQHPADAD
jgi:hypothetical protein